MSEELNYVEYLRSLPEDEVEPELESKIDDASCKLLDAETVASAVASSNATGWGKDEIQILDWDLQLDAEARVRIGFTLSGNQEDDKSFAGTSIEGEAIAVIAPSGDVRFRNVTAELASDCEEEEPEKL